MSDSFPASAGIRRRRSIWRHAVFRLVAGSVGLLALGCCAWAIDNELDEARAIDGLRQGGYVVYLRHADRHKGPKENLNQYSAPAAFADCSHQRNLTAEGRRQAQNLGRYFRELDIPVDRVIANAQCRTRDTALLAFGKAELDPRIYDPGFVRRLMSVRPQNDTNTVVVGNDAQFIALTGIQLGRAEAAIVAPDSRGGFDVVAELDLDDWQEAAEPGWWPDW